MEAVDDLAAQVGVADACRVLGVPRSSYYRARQAALTPPSVPPKRPSPAWPLDESVYLCSWRTMYRILSAADKVRERRD